MYQSRFLKTRLVTSEKVGKRLLKWVLGNGYILTGRGGWWKSLQVRTGLQREKKKSSFVCQVVHVKFVTEKEISGRPRSWIESLQEKSLRKGTCHTNLMTGVWVSTGTSWHVHPHTLMQAYTSYFLNHNCFCKAGLHCVCSLACNSWSCLSLGKARVAGIVTGMLNWAESQVNRKQGLTAKICTRWPTMITSTCV